MKSDISLTDDGGGFTETTLRSAYVTEFYAANPGYAAKLPREQSIRTVESFVCDTLTTEGI
jgi:hypothetical protein